MNDALLVAAVTCMLIITIGGLLTQRAPRWSGSDGSDASAEAEGLGKEAAVIAKPDEDQEAAHWLALGLKRLRRQRSASVVGNGIVDGQSQHIVYRLCRRREARRPGPASGSNRRAPVPARRLSIGPPPRRFGRSSPGIDPSSPSFEQVALASQRWLPRWHGGRLLPTQTKGWHPHRMLPVFVVQESVCESRNCTHPIRLAAGRIVPHSSSTIWTV
jgi:hypothetical protein